MASYPLFPLEEKEQLIRHAKDWAQTCGLLMKTKEHDVDVCEVAPFMLFPSKFPRQLFQQAVDVQPAMNILYFLASWDYNFIKESLSNVIKTDEFTRKMLDIYSQINDEGIAQSKTLLIQRADYMCHQSPEAGNFNNIAVSFAGLGEICSRLHREVLRRFGMDHEIVNQSTPENPCLDTVAGGIFEAWSSYEVADSIVIFVVENQSRNEFDQRHVEYRLVQMSNYGVKVERLTLTECANRLILDEQSKILRLDGCVEISVIYFRTGYDPSHYDSDFEWMGRLKMERSMAIKCPWIGLQLVNTKKIQQVLAEPDVLERFIDINDGRISSIKATFAGIWALGSHSDPTLIRTACSQPDKFVLKPQLEGGFGNYYGREMVAKFEQSTDEQLEAFILMERISPLVVKNYPIHPFQPIELINCVSELGIFGHLLGDGIQGRILRNKVGGHILRSKGEKVNQGGIMFGAALIDSPFLYVHDSLI